MANFEVDDEALSKELLEGVECSDHGIKRMRQRLGLPKSAVEKEVLRAKTKGVTRQNLSGRIRRQLDRLYHLHGQYGDYRVYRGCVFVFKGGVFVTVLALSNGLQNTKAGGRGTG